MKNTFNYLMILAIGSITIACNNSTNQNGNGNENDTKNFSKIENAVWLIGGWQNTSAEGNMTEIWEKKNDSTYFGTSIFVIGKDTVSSETISLEQIGNELFYTPTVKEQNGGQSVKFTLTSSSINQLIFENPKHDFPSKITYNKMANDSLLAEISGIIEGKTNTQQFPMKRVN